MLALFLVVFCQLVVGGKALMMLGPGKFGDGVPRSVFPARRRIQAAAAAAASPSDYQFGDEKPYRMGVVAVFVNDSGNKVLTCKKKKNRESIFPQGGAEKGETFEQTLYREVLEEIGTNDFEIIGKAERLMAYEFYSTQRSDFRGQMQQWYLCHFKSGMGPDLEKALDDEFSSCSWVSPKKAVDEALYFRRSRYEQGLLALGFLMDQEWSTTDSFFRDF
jgi:8-oxo-dGTP pyrophosphatase MutT (NUDIX family)